MIEIGNKIRTAFVACLVTAAVGFGAAGAYAATINMVVFGNENQDLIALVRNYHKTKVNITFVQNPTDFQGILIKNPPDVVMGNSTNISELLKIDFFADLTTYISDRNLIPDLLSSTLKAYSRGKSQFCLPIGGRMTTLNYNQAMFTKAGVQAPQQSWRYREEYMAALRKLTRDTNGDGITDQWGTACYPYNDWAPLAYSFGARFFSDNLEKYLFTDNAATDVMNFIEKIHTDKLAYLQDSQMLVQKALPFLDGNVGMITTSSFIDPSLAKFTVGTSLPPKDKKGSVTFANTMGIGIYTKSKNRADAGKLITYLASQSAQKELYKSTGLIPTSRSLLKSAKTATLRKDINKEMLAGFVKASVLSIDPEFKVALAILQSNMNQVFTDKLSISDFMNTGRKTIEEQMTKIRNGSIQIITK